MNFIKSVRRSKVTLISLLFILTSLFFNNCSGGFESLPTSLKDTTLVSDSESSTTPPQSADPTPIPEAEDSEPQTKLTLTSFTFSRSEVVAGEKISFKIEIEYSGPKLASGKNLFVHFVKDSNPNWFEFSMYPVPGPSSETWSGLIQFEAEFQMPLTALGVYSVQVGINDPESQAPSKNIQLNHASPFKETFGSGEIGYRYVASQINVKAPAQPPVVEPPTQTSFITFDQFRNDVAPQAILKSDYLLAKPAETYHDWYYGWRPGYGPNPPPGFSAQVGWYELFTNRSNPPGPHNWGVSILRIIEMEERSGQWIVIRDTTDPEKLQKGIRMMSYAPQIEGPIEKRIVNGRFEVKMPDEGGNFHGFLDQISINGSGATHRLVLVKTGLVVWDKSKADDRVEAIQAGKAAVCHVGLDYWRYVGAPFLSDFSNNSDMGIGRSRVIGLIENPSWHSHHTIPYADTAKIKSALEAISGVIKDF